MILTGGPNLIENSCQTSKSHHSLSLSLSHTHTHTCFLLVKSFNYIGLLVGTETVIQSPVICRLDFIIL